MTESNAATNIEAVLGRYIIVWHELDAEARRRAIATL